jgi:aspartokinase/homoserine dehydrogenase 1
MAEKGERVSSDILPDRAVNFLLQTNLPNCVLVDCTDAEAPATFYYEWMKRDIHIITPNKKLLSGPLPRYDMVRNLTRNSYTQFYYEVGCHVFI